MLFRGNIWRELAVPASIITVLFNPLESQAASEVFQAGLVVRQAVQLTETNGLTLGAVAQPTDGSARFILNPDGSTSSSLAGGFLGGESPALLQVQGDPGGQLDINATGGACSSPDIQLNDVSLSSSQLNLDPLGAGQIAVGIDLELAAGTATGSYSCAYTIQVNYQ